MNSCGRRVYPSGAGKGLPLTRVSRRSMLRAGVALLALPALAGKASAAAEASGTPRVVSRLVTMPGAPFVAGCHNGRVTSLRAAGGVVPGDFVLPGRGLGSVHGKLRVQGASDVAWSTFDTALRQAPVQPSEVEGDGASAMQMRYPIGHGVTATVRVAVTQAGLRFDIDLANHGDNTIEFGDVAMPLPINDIQASEGKDPDGLLKHSFISGRGSHAFWQRKDLKAPWLAIFPQPGCALEYWDAPKGLADLYQIYFHASSAVAAVQAAGARWRLPATSLLVAPGEARRMGVVFELVDGYEEMRQRIISHGLVDVEVVPGMTVPSDLHALISLGADVPVTALEPEFPNETRVEALGMRAGRQIYRLTFGRLGENQVTVRQADGGCTTLEFFATEPVETLIAKRAAFIVAHQHRDSAKWYNGLFGEWNMADQVLLGPDNYDRISGWRIYEVTCDDPGLAKPAFLAAKLAEYGVQHEVDALDDYVEHFVWGGLQKTDKEDFPYAIYGIPDWKQNRVSADPGPKGRSHVWRVYDYPHIFAMYFCLYRIACEQPGISTRLPATTYLDRAFHTVRAMYTIPKKVLGWDARAMPCYNELVILQIIDALRQENMAAAADELTGLWDEKVHHFIEKLDDLYVSEYAFDSTGFETTQAIARYALERPDRFPPAASRTFDERQFQSNLFCRGWLEPSYYYLGSDYRTTGGNAYTLSYMAQMGGWAVLDHALEDAGTPHPLFRLGYASTLSSWALMNSGTAATNYGYWYPGKANDGGAGGGFEPAALGETWLEQPHHHGSWYYSCEIDLGFCGALRAASTMVADDDLFGRIVYCGQMEQRDGIMTILPRDGVRRRFHARLGGLNLDLELAGGARFSATHPLELAASFDRLNIVVEHPAGPQRRLPFTFTASSTTGWTMQTGSDAPLPLTGASSFSVAEGATTMQLSLRALSAQH